MKDPNPRIRIQAIRASETLFKAGNRAFDADYRALAKDADADVAIQAMLSLGYSRCRIFLTWSKARRRRTRGEASGNRRVPASPAAPVGRMRDVVAGRNEGDREGSAISQSVCLSVMPATVAAPPLAGAAPGTMMAPPLAGSPRVNAIATT